MMRTFSFSNFIGEKNEKLIIAGPCSVETEKQYTDTVTALAKNSIINVNRGGIWKPRTRPGGFEGVGEIGLSWMKQAKSITKVPTCVEVANAKQIELALQYDTDILWIGARTTVNPFSVQEIADALRGVQVPILIKNPVNPDLNLWMGAIERIYQAGIEEIGLIHRGFSSVSKTDYRNAPMWHLAIEMRKLMPNLLMLTDPSHICGKRSTLQEVSQKAVDFGFDGLMIESHISPDVAWSDAEQQLTPEDLFQLLNQIVWREKECTSASKYSPLESLRHEIDQIDAEILQFIAKRMKVAEKIGLFKAENNMAIVQPKRFLDIVSHAQQQAKLLGLSKEFIDQYFNTLHLESIRHQEDMSNHVK